MNLPTLPLDVLLVVLRGLDIVDVVRAGMICKDLYGVVQDRHVWIDQLEKLCQNEPALRTATPPLASLSAQELQTFVINRVKLCHIWDRDEYEYNFTTRGLVKFSPLEGIWLLPGGKSLVVVGYHEVTLCRIKFEDGQFSLPVVASLPYGLVVTGSCELLTAMSPSPILLFKQENRIIHLIRVDHHHGAMSLETTFPIPEGYNCLKAHGHGRVVGFLIWGPEKRPQGVVVHLDYPGVSMEPRLSPHHAVGSGCSAWNICIPAEGRVIIYNTQQILAYEIPNFSSLSFGINRPGAAPMWELPGPGQEYKGRPISYTTSGTLYSLPSARELNLHYVYSDRHHGEQRVFATTVTIPINTKDGPASSTRPPALGQESTPVQSFKQGGWFASRKGLHLELARPRDDLQLGILVTSLNGPILEGRRKSIQILVGLLLKDVRGGVSGVAADMDEATGRVLVVLWGWGSGDREAKIFIGDLV